MHDKTTHTVKLRYAPLHVMTRDVKALKSLNPLAASTKDGDKARNILGEAFGSKKAKRAIQATERNRVDISAMQGVVDHLQDGIEAGTGSLPSQSVSGPSVHSSSLLTDGWYEKWLPKSSQMRPDPFHDLMFTRNHQMRLEL